MKRLVIGILAHVDAGKTTLSEGLLFRSGQIRKLGRVDHRDAFLDTHSIERERGITIFAKQAVLELPELTVTLLDTPGHVDFSTEMERTLQVLDYAVLVISGSDGVQSHTETLWRLLSRYQIPTFLFVNKMDLAGTDQAAILSLLQKRLSGGCVDFSGARDGDWEESLALCDEALLEHFLGDGAIPDSAIRTAIQNRSVYPCFFGSALRLSGVDEFLEGLLRYTEMPYYPEEFGAKVFKILTDTQGNRLTYLKITGGSLKVRELVNGRDWSEKVNQLRIYSGTKFNAVEEAPAGSVCAVTGFTRTYPGEGLGIETDSPLPVLQPVLTYRVELPPEIDPHTALGIFRKLEEEDPALSVVWNERLGELHLQLMGEVQLEVVRRILAERFSLSVEFGQGNIIYKETLKAPVEGIGHFEPLRHYAEVLLYLEPGEPGSGLQFRSACKEDDLAGSWQRLILTHLEEKSHLGVLTGSPITDLSITLLAGRAHLKHTEGGDFRQATYRAVRQGLRSGESVLLEPWYRFRLEVPADVTGRAMSDLQRMFGEFSPPELDGETAVLTGTAPVSAMQGYQKEVTGYTRGRGRLTCMPEGYRPCHNQEEVVRRMDYQPDNDLDNTADSVFCAHGAGFVVKWNQVKRYMHLESGGKVRMVQMPEPEPEVEPIDPEQERRQAQYLHSPEQDKELMQIFERTYGPIRRDERKQMRVRKESDELRKAHGAAVAQKLGPEYLLVDGYNIIHAWEDLREMAETELDAAREMLIDHLCNYQAYRGTQVIVVFDAYKVKGNPGEVEQVRNISVVYTKEAETADMYIEKVTHELGKKYRVRVATSDSLEQLIILGHGALRISARAFYEELEQVQAQIKEQLELQKRGSQGFLSHITIKREGE